MDLTKETGKESYHGDYRKRQTRVSELWQAMRKRGLLTYTTDPSLFEVVWYPLLRVLRDRTLVSGDSGLSRTFFGLWEAWKHNHYPSLLRHQRDVARKLCHQERRKTRELRRKLRAPSHE